jgi:hypothetical protein
VSRAGEPDVVRAIWEALEGSKVVSSLVLGGSRAGGTATELSDRDLYAEGDPDGMMAEIGVLVASLGPLAAFWEPLSEQAGYMVVMDGPVKVTSSHSGPAAGSSRRGCWVPTAWRPSTAISGTGRFGWEASRCAASGNSLPTSWPRCTGSCWHPSASLQPRRVSTRRLPHFTEYGQRRWTHLESSFSRS